MAEALVGGALLSSFLNVLFERLATKEVVNLFRGKKVILKLLEKLETMLLSANALLKDAEEKQFRDQNVKNWLEKLKEVLYEADRVMDKINTEALRLKVEEGESGSKVKKIFNVMPKLKKAFDNTTKSEIQEILDRLKLLLDQTNFLGLKEGARQKPLPITSAAPLVEESGIFGRDATKESLIDSLLSDADGGPRLSVIPIVGMGGIGKTTLAQLAYNDRRVQDHFSLKAWVTVSEDFDVPKLTRLIIETITSRKCDIEERYQLQNKLKEELMGKRFLFVHDDVWNESYQLWELLKSPFEYGAHGSKVIVTTRSRTVATVMGTVPCYELGTLFEEDCLKLLKRHAFSNVDAEILPDLQETIGETVKKCKGLPLAVKAIAGLLRSVPNQGEWRKLLQNDVWELQFQENQKNNIPPALWFSYHFLPQQLKRFFAYCSLFPKDYKFKEDDQEKLIWLWTAEGLLQSEKGKTMEDVGEEYLKALVSRSFFQQLSWNGKSVLMMHDLVHDLAIRVSGEFYFIQDGSNYLHDCRSKIYHLSYLKRHNNKKSESLPEVKFLRTFLTLPLSIQSYGMPVMTQKIQQELLLSAGGCLRALSLSESSITMLPDSISNLKHLRYLDFSSTKLKELPSSVCTLYNLQTLLLSGCRQLEQLPINMCRLISLRHLVIRDTALKEMPPQMCKLTNLQTLSDFVLGEKSGSRIKELGALQNLRGSLCISGIENVVDIGDVLEADLKKKEHLTELILIWKLGETNETSKVRDVLNALEPHRNLKRLEIRGHHRYGGTVWGGGKPHSLLSMDHFALEEWPTGAYQEGRLFPCLKRIFLEYCYKLNVGLPAGCLPFLSRIDIRSCNEMVSVFPASQEIDIAYPSLESIQIWGCEKVESFSEMGLPSNLKELHIRSCNKLIANRRKWNLQRLSNLQRLLLEGCEELVENSFPEEGLLPSSLTSLSIWDFTNLKSLNGKGFQHLASLQHLGIADCRKVEWLPEEGLPLSLSTLEIVVCPLLRERCQRETGEDWPKIQHILNIKINGKKV